MSDDGCARCGEPDHCACFHYACCVCGSKEHARCASHPPTRVDVEHGDNCPMCLAALDAARREQR